MIQFTDRIVKYWQSERSEKLSLASSVRGGHVDPLQSHLFRWKQVLYFCISLETQFPRVWEEGLETLIAQVAWSPVVKFPQLELNFSTTFIIYWDVPPVICGTNSVSLWGLWYKYIQLYNRFTAIMYNVRIIKNHKHNYILQLHVSVHSPMQVIFKLLLTSYLKRDLAKKNTTTINITTLICLAISVRAKVQRDPLVQYSRGLNDMSILTNLLFWQGAEQHWNAV